MRFCLWWIWDVHVVGLFWWGIVGRILFRVFRADFLLRIVVPFAWFLFRNALCFARFLWSTALSASPTFTTIFFNSAAAAAMIVISSVIVSAATMVVSSMRWWWWRFFVSSVSAAASRFRAARWFLCRFSLTSAVLSISWARSIPILNNCLDKT